MFRADELFRLCTQTRFNATQNLSQKKNEEKSMSGAATKCSSSTQVSATLTI